MFHFTLICISSKMIIISPIVQKIYWVNLNHLYMAAQSHGCADHGEVNILHLVDCWSVIGLNECWSNWAQLDYNHKKISINHVIVTKIHPSKATYLIKFPTLYEPMALICVTMAISTWSHGTPTSLGIKSVTYIMLPVDQSCTPLSFVLHPLNIQSELAKRTTNQTDEVLPGNLAVGMRYVHWSAACDDAQSQKESAGHNQGPHSHD